MDFLKKQLDTIQQNLNGLNATQKMLTGALVAIMIMTMVYWNRYAGTAEMEPVLNQSLSDEDVTRMSAALDARGIPYKVEAGKVLVSADKKYQAIGALGFDSALPRNTASGFDQMLAKAGAFDPPDTSEALRTHGREITLGQVLSTFPNVASAVVMIDPTSIRRFGNESVTPSATISLSMKNGAPADNKLANAAADLVSGAVANMSRAKIKVVIDGRTHRIRADDADGDFGGSDTQLEAIQSYERSVASKIENQLQYISGVVANVTGTLDVQTEETKSITNDEHNTLVEPLSVDDHSVETSNSQTGGGEPGVLPNTGASVAGAGGNNNTSTETQTKTQNTVLPSTTSKLMKKPAGGYTVESASVRIPRSYFVNALKSQNGGKEPTSTEIQDFVKAELADVKTEIRNFTGIKSDDKVFVGTYAEPMAAALPTSAAGVSGPSTGISSMLDGWGKEAGVGALAVVSLFMLSTMVKRSTPAPMVVASAEPKEAGNLDDGETIAGFATDGSQSLAGMELDADTLQTQQVVDQVTNLVGENPDAAANLVKRWLNRT